nr:hypothetical protein [uncultured Oscillibacter sp.]
MSEQENGKALTTFRGTVTEGSCKINWETTTIGGHPAVSLMFAQSKKKTNYKIDPEPEKSSQSSYEKLVQAAAHKAGLRDPEMSFPSSILNVSVSGRTYNLHKG